MEQTDGGKESEKDYHKWTVEEEKELLNAMVLAKAAGHKSPQGFRSRGAPFMLEQIKKVCPDTKLKLVPIRNHLKTWRRQFSVVLDLKALSGTGWDEETKMFNCTDKEWKYFTKKHSILKGKKNTAWVYYDQWVDIYGTGRAVGKSANDFESAAKKILADDRYRSILDCDCTGEGEAADDGGQVPEASDFPSKSKRQRARSANQSDENFLATVQNIMNGSNDKPVIVQKQIDPTEEMRDNINNELKKHVKLHPRERLVIGENLVEKPGTLRYFYSLNHKDRDEWLKIKLMTDLNIDPWEDEDED